MDEKSQKCVFLGYSDVTKGYKFLDVKTNKLVVSRYVIFDEKTTWNWEDKKIENTAIISSNQEFEKDEDVSQGGEIPDSDNEESPPRGTKMLSDIYQRCNFAGVVPDNYEEAIKYDVSKKAMEEKIRMIEKNNTWELVAIPRERKVISLKWIYKIKLNQEGDIQKFKTRLVAKGFTQKPGIDFYETLSSVARLETIRNVIVVAAQKKWKIFQLDVKSAFLNEKLDEEIYVEQPQEFFVQGGRRKGV